MYIIITDEGAAYQTEVEPNEELLEQADDGICQLINSTDKSCTEYYSSDWHHMPIYGED